MPAPEEKPLVITPHGVKAFCKVGDRAIDIMLPHPDGTMCPQCEADVSAIHQVAIEAGLTHGRHN